MNQPTPRGDPPPFCTCPVPYARLVAEIEEERLPALPADTLGAANALYQARCAECGAVYPGHWRIDPGHARAS